MDHDQPTSELLGTASQGQPGAKALLAERLYDAIRGIAAQHLERERPDHTLQPTALVHEAWIRLLGDASLNDADRSRFLTAASHAIRRVLIDYARRRRSAKRGGGRDRETLTGLPEEPTLDPAELIDLDDALGRLAEQRPRCAKVVELRYFGGLTNQQIADAVEVSTETVREDWNFARAWLARELRRGAGSP